MKSSHDAPSLDRHFAALRKELESHGAPPHIESALQAAWSKQAAKRPWHRRFSLERLTSLAGLSSIAAAALLVLGAVQQPHLVSDSAANLPLPGNGEPFIALQSEARLASEPNPRLLQAELPRTVVASLGVPISPDVAADTLRAELLVGSDGEPLALRLAVN